MHSPMFVIGSIFLAASSTDNYFADDLKFSQDWICSWHTRSCYWVTDDLNRLNGGSVVHSADCRYDQPEITMMTSMFVNTHVSSLCGCQYCSFTIPSAAPTRGPTRRPTLEPTLEPTIAGTSEATTIQDPYVQDPYVQDPYVYVAPTTLAPTDMPTTAPTPKPTYQHNWMTFDQENFFRTKDTTSPMEWINFFFNHMGFSLSSTYFLTGTGNYTVFFCTKNLETPYDTTCEPIVICSPSPLCQKTDKASEVSITHKSTKKASGNMKSLWGLLFLPGFFVGICAAYGVYRQRVKNRKEKSKKAHFIEPKHDNQVSVPQNQPALQNIPNYQQNQGVPHTNGGERHMDESIAVMH